MDIDYRGTTVEISSIPAVTPQQANASPRYYRKFHLQNRGIPAVTAVLSPSPLPYRALLHRLPQGEDVAYCNHYGGGWHVSVTKGFRCIDIRK